MGEVGIGSEAGFDQAEFEKLAGDAGEVGLWKFRLAEKGSDLSAQGLMVAFGFERLVAKFEAAQSGFAGADVKAKRGRTEEGGLDFLKGVLFEQASNVVLVMWREFFGADARGRAVDVEIGAAVFDEVGFFGIGKKFFGGELLDLWEGHFGEFGKEQFEALFFGIGGG